MMKQNLVPTRYVPVVSVVVTCEESACNFGGGIMNLISVHICMYGLYCRSYHNAIAWKTTPRIFKNLLNIELSTFNIASIKLLKFV